MGKQNITEKVTLRFVGWVIVIFFTIIMTIYAVTIISIFKVSGDILWPLVGQGLFSIAIILTAIYILYSLPRWLGRIVDHFSTKKGSKRAIDQAMGEYRLNQLREEGKKMDGQMYYQQKGY